MSKRFEAVVEVWTIGDFKAWKVVENPYSYISLSKNTTELEAASILAEIASYNSELEIEDDTAAEIVKKLIDAECLLVSGGLKIVDGEKKIYPGCCCGLETWNEWLELSPEKNGMWLGHDPSPYVEFLPDTQIYRIYSDDGMFDVDHDVRHIDFSATELAEALTNVSQDLQDFTIILKNWTDANFPAQSEKLIETFKRNFNIK